MSVKREIAALKRERVLEAAAELFSERGYYNTTLDDVAARLGVTKPFIYGVFRSKADLLTASFLRVVDLCLGAAEEALQANGPAGERLRALIERIVRISAENLPFNAIFLREEKSLEASALQEVRVKEDRFHACLRRLLEQGAAAGEFEIRDVRVAALAIGGMIGWLYGGRSNIAPDETGAVIDAVADLVIRMVGGDAAALAAPPEAPAGKRRRRAG